MPRSIKGKELDTEQHKLWKKIWAKLKSKGKSDAMAGGVATNAVKRDMARKAASKPKDVVVLKGKLVAPRDWALLKVPASICRGLFEALGEDGAEYPPAHGDRKNYNAHITVMRPDEIEAVGGKEKIDEIGQEFSYQLGPVQVTNPAGWDEMEKVWFVKVESKELEDMRTGHGLTSLPNKGKHPFHLTFAVKRSEAAKAAFSLLGKPAPPIEATDADLDWNPPEPTSIEDEVHAGESSEAVMQEMLFGDLEGSDSKIWDQVTEGDLDPDSISASTGIPAHEVLLRLNMLKELHAKNMGAFAPAKAAALRTCAGYNVKLAVALMKGASENPAESAVDPSTVDHATDMEKGVPEQPSVNPPTQSLNSKQEKSPLVNPQQAMTGSPQAPASPFAPMAQQAAYSLMQPQAYGNILKNLQPRA